METRTETHTIEDLGHGVTMSWLYDGQLLHMTLNRSERRAFDVWADKVMEFLNLWPEELPWLAVHDLSEAMLSPHASKRFKDIALLTNAAHIRGRYAVVVSNNIFGEAIRFFIARQMHRLSSPQLEARCFLNADQALEWVAAWGE